MPHEFYNVLEPFSMLADVVVNAGLLFVELFVVLMFGTTIVLTDVMSLGAKMLCGSLLIWFMVLNNQCICDRCYVTATKML